MGQHALALRDAAAALQLQESQIDVIRAAVCSDPLTDTELALYLWQCQRYGLDPLIREAYCFKSRGRIVIGVSIDGLRKRCADTGHYRPGATRYEYDKEGRLVACHVTVGRWHPLTQTWIDCEESAYIKEFAKGENWDKMPRVMGAKCAEARAIRRLFPNETGGLYERDEIDDARAPAPLRNGAIDTTAEPEPPQPKPTPTPAPRAAPRPTGPRTEAAGVEAGMQERAANPRLEVMRYGALVGLSGDAIASAVNFAKAEGAVPEDSSTWGWPEAEIVKGYLRGGPDADQDGPTRAPPAAPKAARKPRASSKPQPSQAAEEARRAAQEMGATLPEIEEAAAACMVPTDLGAWTPEDGDRVLAELERRKGA